MRVSVLSDSIKAEPEDKREEILEHKQSLSNSHIKSEMEEEIAIVSISPPKLCDTRENPEIE